MTRSALHSTRRGRATPAVAPIARAIRTALAVSTLALSLAVPATPGFAAGVASPPVAVAANGTPALRDDPSHVVDAAIPTAVHADRVVVGAAGIDRDSRHRVAPAAAAPEGIDDLSFVADRTPPAAVTPAGSIDLVQSGVIDIVDPLGAALGLGAADTQVTIRNTGSISAHGRTSAIAIDASGTTVDIANDGSLFAAATYAGGYAPAVGVRVFAESAHVANHAGASLAADAVADGGRARARAVYAVGLSQGVVVDNAGDLAAFAQADAGRAEAHGAYAFGYGGPTTVHNAGDITSHAVAAGGAAYATGINAIGYGAGANVSAVDNTGAIATLAEGEYAYSFGILNLTRQRDGSAALANAGSLDAQARGDFATATGALNLALRYGTADSTNTGDITVVADGGFGGVATGLYNHAYVYDATVDNGGAIDVAASGDLAIAVGIYDGAGTYGDASARNTGTITVDADGGDGFARAIGLAGLAPDTVELENRGTIDVTAGTDAGLATAAGIYGVGSLGISIRNYGDVAAHASSGDGDAYAYGALAFGGPAGIALLVNGGDLLADATATNGTAYAIAGFATADVASLFNDGNATARANASGGDAIAKAAWAYGSYGAVENTGALVADAQATGGDATAHGAETIGYLGAATTNSGDIRADATATGGAASAAGAYTLASVFSAYTTNTGAIAAHATGDTAVSYGVLNAATYLGDAVTINSGDIVATADGGIAAYGEAEGVAWGVYNFALAYGSYVVNSGAILAQATAVADIAGTGGFLQAKAIGAAAMNGYGVWDTAIVNAGDIGAIAETSQGYAAAWAAVARSGGAYGGDTLIDNDGTLSAQARADIGFATAIGAYAASLMGDAAVTNAGDIVAYSRVERGVAGQFADLGYAAGIYLKASYGAGGITNTGTVTGHAVGYGALVDAHGIQAYGGTITVDNADSGRIVAIGEVERFGFGAATGVEAHGGYGVTVTNAGDILAYGSAHGWSEPGYVFLGASGAVGVYAEASFQGDVLVTNTGAIRAIAASSENVDSQSGAAGATGIHAYAKYDAAIANYGDVTASATSDLGIAAAYGALVHGKYSGHVTNAEGATLVAVAQVGSQSGAEYGGRAVAFGVHMYGTDHGFVTNDGTVIAHATATAADATNASPTRAQAWGLDVGAYSNGLDALIVNRGDVEAVASADFGFATAYGTSLYTMYAGRTENAGALLAVANADHGHAYAIGTQAHVLHATYYVPCTPYGCDYSNPTITPDAGESSLVNSGDITAVANAAGGVARSYGAWQYGAFGAGVANTGDVTAVADADHATATGVFVAAPYGSVTVDNAGAIVAAAYGPDATAIAVSMASGGTNSLANTGTIAALGDGRRIAIASADGANASLANGGTIVGAITTGSLDDILDNAAGATWRALGASDFGAGADRISNLGTLLLDHATLRLGDAGEGDAFANADLLAVAGDSALALGGVLRNDGRLVFLDGAADDTLALTGDLAGQGRIGFDVDGTAQAGDWLRIDGNVDAAAVQALDVDFTALPTAASFRVPLVNVSGDSLAGNFVLGDVAYQAGFLALDFALAADIDAGNARDDVFALAVDVTGLDDAGRLAASVAPGVQQLVGAQVGTWRQRSGALPAQGDSRLVPWVRAFADAGDVELAHGGDFGAGDAFAFHQADQGWELGLEARPSDHASVGLLVASSEADQHLRDHVGADHLLGRSVGVFATWRADGGFYVDASQRWTGVQARLRTTSGGLATRASASTFNVEAGLAAGSLGGFRVVPQLQFTRTRLGDIDTLRMGAATFADAGGTSSRARLGVAFDRTVQAGAFVLVPYGAINLVREFAGDYDHTVNGSLAGTSRTGGTGSLLELGLGARWRGWTLTGSVNREDGGARDGVVGSQFTARYSW